MAEQDSQSGSGAQPGQVVTPGGQPQPEQPAQQVPEQQLAASPYALPQSDYDTPLPAQEPQLDDDEAVTWTASEFISHEKDAGWFGMLALAAIVLSVAVYFLTKDPVSTGVVLFVFIVLGTYANRQPRQLSYRVDGSGVQIGDKWHEIGAFRSFSVMPEGAFSSIVLLPLKRFAPLTTLYYPPEDEDKIINILSKSLPFEERKLDPIDRLMQRIRF